MARAASRFSLLNSGPAGRSADSAFDDLGSASRFGRGVTRPKAVNCPGRQRDDGVDPLCRRSRYCGVAESARHPGGTSHRAKVGEPGGDRRQVRSPFGSPILGRRRCAARAEQHQDDQQAGRAVSDAKHLPRIVSRAGHHMVDIDRRPPGPVSPRKIGRIPAPASLLASRYLSVLEDRALLVFTGGVGVAGDDGRGRSGSPSLRPAHRSRPATTGSLLDGAPGWNAETVTNLRVTATSQDHRPDR